MKDIKYIGLIVCLLLTNITMGQDPVATSTHSNKTVYSIGDKLPDDIMKELTAFVGKPIILDFWGTYCGSCISQFPKLKELQEEFNEQIQIVMVTNQTKAVVDKFAGHNEVFRNLGLPSLVENQRLWDSFAFRTIPLQVWIDEKGYVRYITSGSNISSKRIASFLRNEKLDVANATVNVDFDPKLPLWLEGNGRQNKYLKYYSFIMEHVPDAGNLHSIVKDRTSGKIQRIQARNLPIDKLFAMAYGKNMMDNPFESSKRRIIETSDKSSFILPKQDFDRNEWFINNTYCYDIEVPEHLSDDIFEYMKIDLERYFKIKSSIEKREIPCLVLYTVDNANSIKTKGGTPKVSLRSSDNKKIFISNRIMRLFINELQYEVDTFSDLPLIDETGYEGNVDIEFSRLPKDLESLNADLEKYGLIINEEIKAIRMLVLQDAEKHVSP